MGFSSMSNLPVDQSVHLQMLYGWICRNIPLQDIRTFAFNNWRSLAESIANDDNANFTWKLLVRLSSNSDNLMRLMDFCLEKDMYNRELRKIASNIFNAVTWNKWWNDQLYQLLLATYHTPAELVQAAYEKAQIDLRPNMPTSGDQWRIVLWQLMDLHITLRNKQNEMARLVSWADVIAA